MPVIQWDHLQDPLDVDKKKAKKEYAKEADPRQVQNTQYQQRDVIGNQGIDMMSNGQSIEVNSQQVQENGDQSYEAQLIQIKAAEDILLEKLRQQQQAKEMIEAAAHQNEYISMSGKKISQKVQKLDQQSVGSQQLSKDQHDDAQDGYQNAYQSNANVNQYNGTIAARMQDDSEQKIYQQGIVSNNNKTFDIIKKNERLQAKLLQEQQEREKLAMLLMKQKASMNQPTLVSSYPQRDLQKSSLESSFSPSKSFASKKRGTVVYATSHTRPLANFEKQLHENSPDQFQMIHQEHLGQAQTLDLQNTGKVEFNTNRKGPQRRNYAEHMQNKNALYNFNHQQNPIVFNRKSSMQTNNDYLIAQRQSSIISGYNNQDPNIFNMNVQSREVSDRNTPPMSIDNLPLEGGSYLNQIQSTVQGSQPPSEMSKLPMQLNSPPNLISNQYEMNQKFAPQTAGNGHTATVGIGTHSGEHTGVGHQKSEHSQIFAVGNVKSPLTVGSNVAQINYGNQMDSGTNRRTVKMIVESAEENHLTVNSSMLSSQPQKASQSQTDHNETESPTPPENKIQVGQQTVVEQVKGPDVSPQQRRSTLAKLKDVEHAQRSEKEKAEQTKEAMRMQRINQSIEKTSSLKKQAADETQSDPAPRVAEEEISKLETVDAKRQPQKHETQRLIAPAPFAQELPTALVTDPDSWIDRKNTVVKEQPKSPKPLDLVKQQTESPEQRFERNLNLANRGKLDQMNRTQTMPGQNSATQITNKNVLSKKALDALNSTHQIFPFHSKATILKSTGSIYGRQESVRSSLSRLSDGTSKRKIGGLARRRMARESTRQLAEIKKNMSIREQSQLGDSSMSPLRNLRESRASIKAELTQDNEVANIQIGHTPPKETEDQAGTAENPIDGKNSPELASQPKGVGIEIQAKLSQEEQALQRELAEEETKRKMLAQKDEYGAIAVQTSSQTLPRNPSDNDSAAREEKRKKREKRKSVGARSKRERPHPAKAGMSHAGQQLEVGEAENPLTVNDDSAQEPSTEGNREGLYRDQANEPKERDQATDARARDTSTDPMVGEKDTDPRVRDGATDAWKRDGEVQTAKDKGHKVPFDKQDQERKIANSKMKIDERDSTAMRSRKGSRAGSIVRNRDSRNQSRITKMINDRFTPSQIPEDMESSQADPEKPIPVFIDHIGDQKVFLTNHGRPDQKSRERAGQDSRSTQMMFENQFKKRKRSTIANSSKDKGKLVYLPNIKNLNETLGAESITRDVDSQGGKRGKSKQGYYTNAERSPADGQPLNRDLADQAMDKPVEKHHKDKSKCTICIRKRAEREARRAAREQAKLGLQSQNNSAPQNQPPYPDNAFQQQQSMSSQFNQFNSMQNMQQPGNQGTFGNFNTMQQQQPVPYPNGQFSPQPSQMFNQPPYQGQNSMMQNNSNQKQISQNMVGNMNMGQNQYQNPNQNQRGQQQFPQPGVQQQMQQSQPQQLNASQNQNQFQGVQMPQLAQGFPPNNHQQQLNNNYSNSNMFQQNNNHMSNAQMNMNQNQMMPDILNNQSSIQKIPNNQQSIERLPDRRDLDRAQPQLPMINVNGATGYDPMDSNLEISKPIYKFFQNDKNQKSQPLKYFKGQDLEMHYMEKQLKPEVEKEIKEGFFEIKKKFDEDGKDGDYMPGQGSKGDDEVQVYVSHLCLHNFHPIFCKFNLETVKIILNYSSIVYLNKGQTLYAEGFNDQFLYIILFGRLRVIDSQTNQKKGSTLNIGWTVGEEILFKGENEHGKIVRTDLCRASTDGCVLGIEKRNLMNIKKVLQDKGSNEEFMKLEVVLRGNHLVKKDWS